MESSCNTSKDKNKENGNVKSNSIIENIHSKYILSNIYDIITKKKKLEIIKYNKKIQNIFDLSIKDYKEYYEQFTRIEIEIIPAIDKYGKFIHVNKIDKPYYHIYFNDNNEEIKNKYNIYEEDNVTKIKIIIDYQIKSFERLFANCGCIEYIYFKKFIRNNINKFTIFIINRFYFYFY